MDNAEPPLEAAYHLILLPVALKLATVDDTPEQNVCVDEPVGAEGVVLMLARTSSLLTLSHPLTVWLA